MRPRGAAGFTIIELMIVVSIMGVLMALAFPAFDDLIKNSRRTTVVNEIVSFMMTARGEAAKRGQAVTVCGATTSTTPACQSSGNATNWNNGFLVFLDPNANGVYDTGETLLKKYVNDYADLSVSSAVRSGGAGHFTLRAFNQAGDAGALLVCDKRGISKSRRICVSANGRANVSETVCDAAAGGDSSLACP